MIRFGPSGLGGVKEAGDNLKKFSNKGLTACEIAFTYGPYLSEREAEEIGNNARKLDIKISIHASYWVNLNSLDLYKVQQSKKRILECCKIGHKLNVLGGCVIVFHAGFYGKSEKEETYTKIKQEILEIMSEIKENKWNVKLAPEVMGKANVFGSVEEILRLVRETGCSFCVDFAHLYARSMGKIKYSEMYDFFKEFKELHCHFSGIEFGEKGERHHKITEEKDIKELLKSLPKNKDITIINESPSPLEDAEKMLILS